MDKKLLRLFAFGSVLATTVHSTAVELTERAAKEITAAAFGAYRTSSRPSNSRAHRRSKKASFAAAAQEAGPQARMKRSRKLARNAPQQDRRNKREGAVNTWTIFGFTDGADTGTTGERTLFNESGMRLGRRTGASASGSTELGFAYSTSDRAVVWISATGSHERSSLLDAPPFMSSRTVGSSVGVKYQLLQRSVAAIGLSLQAEPFWERTEQGRASHQTAGSEFRLIADAAVVPNRLFAAVNIAYQPDVIVQDGGRTERGSNVAASFALSCRAMDNVFLGAELRYLTKYSTLLLEERLGSAWFAGPTLSFTLGENAYVGVAWSMQFHGSGMDEVHNSLDPVNYGRHQVRLKAGLSF